MTDTATHGTILRGVRRILAGTLTLGLGGTLSDLLLLGHTESAWQLLPIVLLAFGLLLMLCHLLWRRRVTVRLLQVLMVTFLLSGGLGLFLHYDGNVEFALEMNPEMQGFELASEALTGATPALAPSGMILLGLVGLAFAHRHPLTAPRSA